MLAVRFTPATSPRRGAAPGCIRRFRVRRFPFFTLSFAVVFVAGCDAAQYGLEQPPGLTEFRNLTRRYYSALEDGEDRMDTTRPATDQETTGFPFLLRSSHSATEDYRVTDLMYPLYSQRRRGTEREYALRPLFYVRQAPQEDRTDAWFLYPLGRYWRRGDSRRLWFFPFFLSRKVHPGRHISEVDGNTPGDISEFARRRTIAGNTVDIDWMLFPVFFGGSDPEEGSYFAFFPLAGELKDILGKDRIRFLFFPLYVETIDRRYHSRNFLWPIFGWWRGEDVWGWRFWPIYGTNRRQGRYERTFFLWPLFHYWYVGQNTKNPTKAVFFLPFYGQIINDHMTFRTFLWPLFGRRHDDRRNLIEWHAPWPVFCWTRGDAIRGLRIWPLWGHRSSNTRRTMFFMWPLYTRDLKRETERTVLTRSAAGIFWQWTERWREYDLGGTTVTRAPPRLPGKLWRGEEPVPDSRTDAPADGTDLEGKPFREYERTFWKLWPICHYRKGADDSRVFQFLSPLPWKTDRGAANILAPFWTLYRFEKNHEGQIREYALFGLYHNIRDAKQRDVNVLGVFQYRRVGWYYRYFGILGGLVSYERVGYDKGMRILWIPVNRIAREEWDKFRTGAFEEEP